MSVTGLKNLSSLFLGLPMIDDTTTPDDLMETLTSLAEFCMEPEIWTIWEDLESRTKRTLIVDSEKAIMDKAFEESLTVGEFGEKVQIRVAELRTQMSSLYHQCINATQEFDWAKMREFMEAHARYTLTTGMFREYLKATLVQQEERRASLVTLKERSENVERED